MRFKAIILLMLICTLLCSCGSDNQTGNVFGKSEKGDVIFDLKDNAPNSQPVEITMDNWLDYFENIEIMTVKYNEFDEPRDVEIDQIYALKEGYQIDKSRTEIAVEYACHYEGFYMSLDYDNLKYSCEMEDEEYNDLRLSHRSFSGTTSFQDWNYLKEDGTYQTVYGLNYGSNYFGVDNESELQKGTICFLDEIIRINGSIYICSTEQLKDYYDTTQFVGTPRLLNLEIFARRDYSTDTTMIWDCQTYDVYNVKYNKIFDNVEGTFCGIVVDNDTPTDLSDDKVVCLFCE